MGVFGSDKCLVLRQKSYFLRQKKKSKAFIHSINMYVYKQSQKKKKFHWLGHFLKPMTITLVKVYQYKQGSET